MPFFVFHLCEHGAIYASTAASQGGVHTSPTVETPGWTCHAEPVANTVHDVQPSLIQIGAPPKKLKWTWLAQLHLTSLNHMQLRTRRYHWVQYNFYSIFLQLSLLYTFSHTLSLCTCLQIPFISALVETSGLVHEHKKRSSVLLEMAHDLRWYHHVMEFGFHRSWGTKPQSCGLSYHCWMWIVLNNHRPTVPFNIDKLRQFVFCFRLIQLDVQLGL